MSRGGMEAPKDDTYGTVVEWRRSPAQPVTELIVSTRPSLRLKSHNLFITMRYIIKPFQLR